jgi:hypothetical protein
VLRCPLESSYDGLPVLFYGHDGLAVSIYS